jgi:thymidylate synthase
MEMKTYQDRTVDWQYHNLLKEIMTNGRDVMPIHGEIARKITGATLRYPTENGFPLITERDVSGRFFTGALAEHIAFLNGARTHEDLKAFGCSWWKRWVTKEKCEMFGLTEGDLGPGSYGAAWANFPTAEGEAVNQIKSIVEQIREKPYLRTHIISPWIPQYTLSSSRDNRKVVVAPCHGLIHVHVYPENKKLEILHWQRSADVPVGLVFNIIQYAAFGAMLAQVLGYQMIGLVHQISDAHIYESQLPYVKELLEREPRRFPSVSLDPNIDDMFSFRPEHFTLGNDYDPYPSMVIPTPV